jgi:hypothetical protein
MQEWQLWLLLYDPSVEKPEHRLRKAMRLRGEDDPSLALYRRCLNWLSRRNSQQALSEIRQVLLDPQEELASRVTALYSLTSLFPGNNPNDPLEFKRPGYVPVRRVLLELSKQSKLPAFLQALLINQLMIDPSREV